MKVPCLTIPGLLAKTKTAVEDIVWLIVDTEGVELELVEELFAIDGFMNVRLYNMTAIPASSCNFHDFQIYNLCNPSITLVIKGHTHDSRATT